jgi:hypothetical protein
MPSFVELPKLSGDSLLVNPDAIDFLEPDPNNPLLTHIHVRGNSRVVNLNLLKVWDLLEGLNEEDLNG